MRRFNDEYGVEPKRAKLCFVDRERGVYLHQYGKDSFAVTYGKQVDDRLTYGEAAKALGAALMHALACESALDNRMPGER